MLENRALTEGVVVIGHDVGERVRDISTCDNLFRFIGLVAKLATTGVLRRAGVLKIRLLTSRKEKMIHPKNSHRPMLKGIATQLCESAGQLLKIVLDQDFVVNMVTAV